MIKLLNKKKRIKVKIVKIKVKMVKMEVVKMKVIKMKLKLVQEMKMVMENKEKK